MVAGVLLYMAVHDFVLVSIIRLRLKRSILLF